MKLATCISQLEMRFVLVDENDLKMGEEYQRMLEDMKAYYEDTVCVVAMRRIIYTGFSVNMDNLSKSFYTLMPMNI
jgi:hypothetical protein